MQDDNTRISSRLQDTPFPSDDDVRDYSSDDDDHHHHRGFPFHGPEVFVEITHGLGSTLANFDWYAPPLRIRRCRACGRQVLRARLGSNLDFWVEPVEPCMPWIEIGFSIAEFMYLIGFARVHNCLHAGGGAGGSIMDPCPLAKKYSRGG